MNRIFVTGIGAVTPIGTVTGVAGGPCVIDAAQAGNADYAPASSASLTLTIGAASQNIAFGIVPPTVVGATGTVTAVATSGLR